VTAADEATAIAKSTVRIAPDDASGFNSKVSTALEMLARYIPTEIIALYLAALSIAPAFKETLHVEPPVLYWFGVVLTPILLTAAYLTNSWKANHELPKLKDWPWWKAFAATAAFATWALAVPGNGLIATASAASVTGFMAILVSLILSWIGNFFDAG